MAKYHVYGKVTGTTYVGEYEADTPEAAIKMAETDVDVGLCHRCARKCSDAEAELFAEPDEDPALRRARGA